MKKNLLCLLLCFLLLPFLTGRAAAVESVAVCLEKTEGSVAVLDAAGSVLPAEAGRSLGNAWVVQTGSESYAWISLDDTKSVKLDENTQLELRKHGKKIQLNLISGSILVGASAHLEDDEELTIRTATMITGIRGTDVHASVVVPTPVIVPTEGSRDQVSIQSSKPAVMLSVLDGVVSSQNSKGTVTVSAGETVTVTTDAAPAVTTLSLDELGAFAVQEIKANDALRDRVNNPGMAEIGLNIDRILEHGGTQLNPGVANSQTIPTQVKNLGIVKKSGEILHDIRAASTHTHNWGAPVYQWDEDHNCSAIRICSTNSAHVEHEKAAAVCETVKATCEEDGSMTYTVVFQNAAFQTQTDRVVLTALGHDFAPKSDSDWIPYTEGGQVLYYYLKCAHEDCTEIESEIEYLNRIQNTETVITSYSGLMANQSEENTLTVSAGKTVNIKNLSLAEGNSIDVYGTLNLTVSDAKQIIRNNGSIRVKDNGTLNISGTMESVNAITVSEYGTLNLLVDATLNIQADRSSFSGTVNMTDGSSLNTFGAVVINGTLNIAEDASAAINGELKNGTAGTITLANNARLTVSGIVSNEATLTLEAGSTLTIVGLMENRGTLTLDELAVLKIQKPEAESDTTVLNNHGTILLADDSFLTVSHEIWNAVDDSSIKITAQKTAPARIQSAAMTNNGSFTVASGAGLTLLSDEESPVIRNYGILSVETGGELKAESYVLNNYGTVKTAANSLLQINEIISYGQLIIGSDSSMTAEYLNVYAEGDKEPAEQEQEPGPQSAPAPKLVIDGNAVVSQFYCDIEDASVGETGSLTLGGDSKEEPYSGISGTLSVSGQLIVNRSLSIETMGGEPEVNGQVNILSTGTLTVHTISYMSSDRVTIEPTASQNINAGLPEAGNITCFGQLHIFGTLNYAILEQIQPT